MKLRDYIASCARRYPDKAAYIYGQSARTWRQIHERSDRLAAALQGFGLKAGDRVGILSRNRIEIVEQWFACLKAGLVRVGFNWRYSAREIAHVAQDADVRILIVEADCAGEFRDSLAALSAAGVTLVGFGEGHGLTHDYETLLQRAGAPTLPEVDDEDLVMIAYTSGTTGMPKGVMFIFNDTATT